MLEREKNKLAVDYINGYAQGFITDEECSEMIDLTLNEITSIKDNGGIPFEGEITIGEIEEKKSKFKKAGEKSGFDMRGIK